MTLDGSYIPEYDYYDNCNNSDIDECYESPCHLSINHPVEIMVQTWVHSFICAFGLIGNVLVIVTYAFYKRTKTMTDVYLLNVAVADLLFVVALPVVIYNERNAWSMGSLACKLLAAAYSINLYSSMLLLACVSCDRYVAIVQARRSFGTRSRFLACSRLVCLAVWALAVVLTAPSVVYTELIESDLQVDAAAECLMRIDDTQTAVLMKVLLPSLQVSLGFLLPLAVMVVSYSSIARTLLGARGARRHRAVRVVLAVVVVFIVCHAPYNAALLVHTAGLFKARGCEAEQVKVTALSISRSLAYLHCCLNPFLYAFIGERFRSHLRKILEDLWCLGKKYIHSVRPSTQTSDLYISGRPSADGCTNHNGSSFTM